MTPQEPIYDADDVDGETYFERGRERQARRDFWNAQVYDAEASYGEFF